MERFDFILIGNREYQILDPTIGKIVETATCRQAIYGDLRHRCTFIKRIAQTCWWRLNLPAKSETPLLDARAARFFELYSSYR